MNKPDLKKYPNHTVYIRKQYLMSPVDLLSSTLISKSGQLYQWVKRTVFNKTIGRLENTNDHLVRAQPRRHVRRLAKKKAALELPGGLNHIRKEKVAIRRFARLDH